MEIRPYAKNAKKHPKKQIEQIMASIKEFGMNQPIVVDKDGVIIVGHGRYEALKALGMEITPEMVKVVDLTEEQAKSYRLADNKLNESEWDMNLVIEELKDLSEPMLELTGFDKDLIIEPDEKDDEVPDVPEEPRSKLGDLYELGEHRLLCGDSTKIEDVEKLMDGKKADMVFTSPPYSDMREYNGDKELGVEHLAQFIAVYSPYTDYQVVNLGIQRKEGAIYPYWDEYTRIAKEAGYKMLAWNIWSKRGKGGSVANMTAMFQIEHEWIFVFGIDTKEIKRTKPNKMGGQIQKGGSNRMKDGSTKKIGERKIEYFGKLSSVLEHDFQRGENLHSATYPVGIVEEYIKAMAEESVIDPFLGSGSTLIASEKTGRICYGMELDPRYTDVIVTRYCDYTGNTKIKKNGEEIIWQKK